MKNKEEKVKNKRNAGEVAGKVIALVIAGMMVFSVAISVIYAIIG